MIWLLTFIFILGIACFGFGHNFELIKLSGVGVLNLSHVLLIIAYIFSIMRWKSNRMKFTDPALLPLSLLIFFIFFQAFRNIILDGFTYKLIIGDLKTLDMLFFFVPLIILIKNKKTLFKFIYILLILGGISSIVSIFQFTTGTELRCSMIRHFVGPFFRVYHPNAIFIAICLFISFSFYLNFGLRRGHFWKYLLIPIYIFALLTTLHRSLIITSFICIIIIFFINLITKSKFRVIIKQMIFIILLFVITIYFLNSIGLGTDPVSYRIGTSYADTRYLGGTVESRIIKVLYQLSSIKGNYPFGLGFQYNPEFMDSSFDPMALSSDIMYGNIMIFLGIVGIIIFLLLFLTITKTSFKLFKTVTDLHDRTLFLAFIPLGLFFFLIGFFSSIFFWSPDLSTLIVIISILYLLKYFNDTQKHENINNYSAKPNG